MVHDYEKDKNTLVEYATNLVKMELDYDYSMFGEFMDELVVNYMRIRCADIISFISDIDTHQEKDCETYGDMDSSFIKFSNVLNTPPLPDYYKIFDCEPPKFIWKAYQVIGHSSSRNYIIIKSSKIIEGITDKYYIYSTRDIEGKKLESVDYRKVIKYGDVRDRNYIFEFEVCKLGDNLEITSDNGNGIETYREFYNFYRELRSIVFDIKQE